MAAGGVEPESHRSGELGTGCYGQIPKGAQYARYKRLGLLQSRCLRVIFGLLETGRGEGPEQSCISLSLRHDLSQTRRSSESNRPSKSGAQAEFNLFGSRRSPAKTGKPEVALTTKMRRKRRKALQPLLRPKSLANLTGGLTSPIDLPNSGLVPR